MWIGKWADAFTGGLKVGRPSFASRLESVGGSVSVLESVQTLKPDKKVDCKLSKLTGKKGHLASNLPFYLLMY